MKRFFFKILIIITPFVVIMGYVEYVLRSIPNDYKYKKEQIEKMMDHIRVISLGASHGYYGINPSFLTYNGYNLAFVSQSFKYDYWLYKTYVEDSKSIQYLILPVSYPMLRAHLDTGVEWWRIKGYCIYMGCNYHFLEPKYHFELSTKEKLKQFKVAWLNQIDNVTCDSLGWCTNYKKEFRKIDWVSSGPVACKRHTNPSQFYVEENIRYIKKIINHCERRNIKVILLTTPTYNSYYDLLEPLQLNEMLEICYELDNKYEHVVYLNWLKHSDFTEEDFFDADHLNEYGAEKLTKMLDQYIMNWE